MHIYQEKLNMFLFLSLLYNMCKNTWLETNGTEKPTKN